MKYRLLALICLTFVAVPAAAQEAEVALSPFAGDVGVLIGQACTLLRIAPP